MARQSSALLFFVAKYRVSSHQIDEAYIRHFATKSRNAKIYLALLPNCRQPHLFSAITLLPQFNAGQRVYLSEQTATSVVNVPLGFWYCKVSFDSSGRKGLTSTEDDKRSRKTRNYAGACAGASKFLEAI